MVRSNADWICHFYLSTNPKVDQNALFLPQGVPDAGQRGVRPRPGRPVLWRFAGARGRHRPAAQSGNG